MEEITYKRLLRWTLASFIAVVMIAYGFGVGIASAETGTILLDDEVTYTHVKASGGQGSTFLWGTINYDSANYNYISSFHVTSPGFSFSQDFNSTAFTITSGGTGGGNVWYDKNWSTVYYVFSTTSTFTSSPIVLSFSKDIFSQITQTVGDGNEDVSSTKPICIKRGATPCASNTGGLTYQSTVSTRATDTYSVIYPNTNYFDISIDKNTAVNTKYKIYGGASTYSTETSFNKVDINNATFLYNDGIYLNTSLASGYYVLTTINITGDSGTVQPGESPSDNINPSTGVGIVFDSSSYTIGETANISWIRSQSTPILCTDYIYHTYPDTTKTAIVTSPPDSGHFKESMNILGLHTTSFERECLFQSAQVLDSDTATVSSESPSYIIATSPQGAGIAFNVTYAFGYTPQNQGELNSIVIDKLTNDVWVQSNAVSLNNTAIVAGTEYNKSITVGDIGKYRIRLFELNRGYVAQAIIDSIAVNIPTLKNISNSIIEVDKYEYLKSDEISIYYAIDNTNYSNYYSKYISIIHASGSYPETSHILLTEQEDTINYASSSGHLQRAKQGINYVQLHAKNNTADIILTNTSFNISFIDSEGYGLDVVDPEVCKGEKITIKYSTPTLSTLRINIASDTSVPTKYYEIPINGTRSIDLKLSQAADYQILIYEGTVGNIKKFTTAKADTCGAAATPGMTGGAAMQTQTDNFLSSGMFIVMIILILFAGAGLHFGGIGGAIIGFGAGFIFSAIYGLIPLWALFLFAILVITAFAVMAGKTLTGGDGGN